MSRKTTKKAKRRRGTSDSKKLLGAHVVFELVSGVEGPCLCISGARDEGGFRLAGPKPWGGGTVSRTFKVDYAELIEKAKLYRTPNAVLTGAGPDAK